MKTNQKIGMMALALLITGAIDSIRNMPTTALFGPKLIFFALLGALLFLIPIGLVSAQLVTSKQLKPGIYEWVKKALGERFAFAAIWLQWINTMVWYPTILSFIAGTFAYMINPHLAQQKGYLAAFILVVFWALTLINLKGFKASAWVASVSAMIGMVIPIFLIIFLGIVWAIKGMPMAIAINAHTILPKTSNAQSWISLTAIITSFLGMELACVHAKDVDNPGRSFPKALMISVFFILATMILGSLVIAWVLPQSSIHLVDGTMQVFSQFLSAYHLQWALPVVVMAIVIGSIGGMINWVISPAKGLLQAANDNFLPKVFRKLNKAGVATNLLITQAVVVSVVCLAFVLMPSVNGVYWLLTDLSTELYVVMYVFFFASALVLLCKNLLKQASFRIMGGKVGFTGVCSLGLIGCLVTLVIGFLPPGNINVGGAWHYFVTFSSGMLLMILPIGGFYWYKSRNKVPSDSFDVLQPVHKNK